MPAELFRSALPSTSATRRASLLPFSIGAHVVVLTLAVIGPRLADIDLAITQSSVRTSSPIIDFAPPPPPAVTLKPPPSQQAPTTSPDKPPIEAPTEIKPESGVEPYTSDPTSSFGDLGPPFGVEDAVCAGRAFAAAAAGRTQADSGRRQNPAPAPAGHHRAGLPDLRAAGTCPGRGEIEAVIGEDGKVRNAKVIQGKPC